MTPAILAMVVGQTASLTADVRDPGGLGLSGRPVTWSTSDPHIVTVSDAGQVTGTAPGTATITASSGGKAGTAAITVVAGESLAPIAGSWAGLIIEVQPNFTFEYTAVISIDGRLPVQQGDLAGTVSYRGGGVDCLGEFRFKSVDGGVFSFDERIWGASCRSGLVVQLSPFGNDGTRLNYVVQLSNRVTTAVLSRSP